MIGRALLTLIGATLGGVVIGALIGLAIGTVVPFTYINHTFGAETHAEARDMGVGYGIIHGSIIGLIIGGLALLYDLGHRFLKTREPKA